MSTAAPIERSGANRPMLAGAVCRNTAARRRRAISTELAMETAVARTLDPAHFILFPPGVDYARLQASSRVKKSPVPKLAAPALSRFTMTRHRLNRTRARGEPGRIIRWHGGE